MKTRARLFQLGTAVLFVAASSKALAVQPMIVANYDTDARAFRSEVGKVVTFVCPAEIDANQTIWGTDVYTDESPVCTAAVHARAWTPGVSGQVTIMTGPEAQSFEGKERNGVTSLSSGPWGATYSFIKNGEPAQIDWSTTYHLVPDDFQAPITVVCPPRGDADPSVWGSDVYASLSSICGGPCTPAPLRRMPAAE